MLAFNVGDDQKPIMGIGLRPGLARAMKVNPAFLKQAQLDVLLLFCSIQHERALFHVCI